MSQNARDRVVADFRAGRVPVLLATNVAARGLDVLSIEQVINYELPESAELFTHRVGRTGRMEREGEAITLLTPDDLAAWRKMLRELGANLPLRPWPHDKMPLPAPTLALDAPAHQPDRRAAHQRGRPVSPSPRASHAYDARARVVGTQAPAPPVPHASPPSSAPSHQRFARAEVGAARAGRLR